MAMNCEVKRVPACAVPTATSLPSGCTATSAAAACTWLRKSADAVPPAPKVASTAPAGVYRARSKLGLGSGKGAEPVDQATTGAPSLRRVIPARVCSPGRRVTAKPSPS